MKHDVIEYSFCQECTLYSETGSTDHIEYFLNEAEAEEKIKAIELGLKEIGANLVYAGFDNEFVTTSCECCKSKLAGERHNFHKIIGL